MAEPPSSPPLTENKFWKGVFAVVGIMSTLVIYGVLQEKIMRVPYGENKEYFPYSVFLVFCNRLTASALSAGALLALKYVSFPVQKLAKCAKTIPVMLWSTYIMKKVYKALDYLLAFKVMLGCAIFILYPAAGDISPYSKGYDMEIHNQIFYTTLCSCVLSLTGLILQGYLPMAVDFVVRHHDFFFDVALLSTVATASQFFISYTIRTFGALTFATIMTTRQLASILLSCVLFAHPLSWEQCIGEVIVFGSLYTKSFLNNKPQKHLHPEHSEADESSTLK